MGCLRERISHVRVCRAGRHHAISRSCAGRRIRKNWLMQAKELGLAGLGIADRNSVAGVVRAHVADGIGSKEIEEVARRAVQGRRRCAARLRRRHARHSGLSAGSRRLGPAHPAALARQAARREGRLHSRLAGSAGVCSKASISLSCRRRGSMPGALGHAARPVEGGRVAPLGLARRRHALSRRRRAAAGEAGRRSPTTRSCR